MSKSAKEKPRLSKSNPKSQQDPNFEPVLIILSSDDDADEDLSSKNIEKTMVRASGDDTSSIPSSSVTELKKKIKKKKKRTGELVNALESVETKNDDGAPKVSDAILETDPSEKSHNTVLQKLLRGPRYFYPPGNSWGNCYNCGEGGHTAANCTSVKHRKPCFVCGSLDHNVKQCNKGKDCPEKSNCGLQSNIICLNCGDSGHEMFSCKSNYSPDDLKEIQCYICKCFGHLCCVNYAGDGSRKVSCYRCGQLSHSGRDCARVHAEKSSKWTPSLCYVCGEEAHTVCKCPANLKGKRKRSSSTPKKEKKKKKKKQKKKKGLMGKHGNELGASSMPQLNPRGSGGWITGDPSAYNHNPNHSHNHGSGPPMTPPMYISNNRFQFHGGNGYQPPNDGFQFHGGNGYQPPNDRFQFHGGIGYQSPNVRFQFHGGNGYQQPNDRFQFHGGSGYQSPNDRFQFQFQFHGGNSYQSPNDRFQFHGGSGYNSGSGFQSNPGMFHAAGSNG